MIDIRTFANEPAAFRADLSVPTGKGERRFGDVMQPFQAERFSVVDPALIAVSKAEAPPFSGLWDERTKGASKDSDHAVNILWLLAFAPRTLRIQIGAYDQQQADELRLIIKAILRISAPLNRLLSQTIDVQTTRIINSRTDSTAEILTADKLGSHGARPDVVLIDELTHQTDDGFASTLLDNADKIATCVSIVATNSGFQGTWQARWKQTFQSSPRWRVMEYSQPAPWISKDALTDSSRRNSQSRFKRLWWGVWSSGAGDALDPADIQAAIRDELAPMNGRRIVQNYDPRMPYLGPPRGPAITIIGDDDRYGFVAGLDLSVSQDHSALVVLASHGETQRIRLADCAWWKPDPLTGKVDLEAVEAAVLDAHKRFQLSAVWFDPYQAALMAQRLARMGVRMRERHFVGKNLDEMATTLLETFRSRRIDLFPCERLVADLHRLSIVEKSYGHKLEATRDKDGHADTGIALAIALPAAVEGIEHAPRVTPWSHDPPSKNLWSMTIGGGPRFTHF